MLWSMSSDPDRWADDLFQWRRGLWPMQRASLAAWAERDKHRAAVRGLRKELAEAEAAFQASDAEAKALEAGEARGFRP